MHAHTKESEKQAFFPVFFNFEIFFQNKNLVLTQISSNVEKCQVLSNGKKIYYCKTSQAHGVTIVSNRQVHVNNRGLCFQVPKPLKRLKLG